MKGYHKMRNTQELMLPWRQKLEPLVNTSVLLPQIKLFTIPGIPGKVVTKNVTTKSAEEKLIPYSLFVGKLSFRCDDEILFEQFKQFQPISAKIVSFFKFNEIYFQLEKLIFFTWARSFKGVRFCHRNHLRFTSDYFWKTSSFIGNIALPRK